jgi:hypothetical protein
MPTEKYDNLWTKLGLGGIRGNPLFRAVWRAVKVGIVSGVLFFLNNYANLLPSTMLPLIPIIATALEKASRTLVLEK